MKRKYLTILLDRFKKEKYAKDKVKYKEEQKNGSKGICEEKEVRKENRDSNK